MNLNEITKIGTISNYNRNIVSKTLNYLLSSVFYNGFKAINNNETKLNLKLAEFGEYYTNLFNINFDIEDFQNIIHKRFSINKKLIYSPYTSNTYSLKEFLLLENENKQKLSSIKESNIFNVPFSISSKFNIRSKLPLPYHFFSKLHFLFTVSKYKDIEELFPLFFSNIDDSEINKIVEGLDIIKNIMEQVGMSYLDISTVNSKNSWENITNHLRTLPEHILDKIENSIDILTDKTIKYFETTDLIFDKTILFSYIKDGIYPNIYTLLDFSRDLSSQADSIIKNELMFCKQKEIPFTNSLFYRFYKAYDVNTPFTVLLNAEAGTGKTTMVNKSVSMASLPLSMIDTTTSSLVKKVSFLDSSTGFTNFIQTYTDLIRPSTRGTVVFLDEIDKAITSNPDSINPIFSYLTSEKTKNDIPVLFFAGQYFEGIYNTYASLVDFYPQSWIKDKKYEQILVLGSAEDTGIQPQANRKVGNTLNTLLSRMFLIFPDIIKEETPKDNNRPKLAIMHTRHYQLLQVFIDTIFFQYLKEHNIDIKNNNELNNSLQFIFNKIENYTSMLFSHYVNYNRDIVDFPEDYQTIQDVIKERCKVLHEYMSAIQLKGLDQNEKIAVQTAISKDDDILNYLKIKFFDLPNSFNSVDSLEALELFNTIEEYIKEFNKFNFKQDPNSWAEYYLASIVTIIFLIDYLRHSTQKHDLQKIKNIQLTIKNSLSSMQFHQVMLDPKQTKIIQLANVLVNKFSNTSLNAPKYVNSKEINNILNLFKSYFENVGINMEIFNKLNDRVNELIILSHKKTEDYLKILDEINNEKKQEDNNENMQQNKNEISNIELK
jgi:hypothetical protein